MRASAGEVVTREQIQSAHWPDGTIVDFDQSINFCVKRVRATLGDDATNPRYVETVAGTDRRRDSCEIARS